VEAVLSSVRLDCLFSQWTSIPPRPDFYLLAGLGVIQASPEVGEEDADAEYVSALKLGLGIVSMEKGWDARLGYSVLTASDNVRGLLSATVGYRF
jgi:hypothetical protein